MSSRIDMQHRTSDLDHALLQCW